MSRFGMSGKQTSDQTKGNTILSLKKQNKQINEKLQVISTASPGDSGSVLEMELVEPS